MNKENCALKLVDEIILYYDARSKKHKKTSNSVHFFVSQKGSVHHGTLQTQTGVILTETFLLLQKDIGFLFVFVKQALFPYVSFRCVCRFCKQMRLVYRQAVRSDVVTVTAIQEYP